MHTKNKSHGRHLKTRLSPLALTIFIAFAAEGAEPSAEPPNEYARNVVEFDSDLLKLGGHNKVDVSRFSYGSSASPGTYKVEIYVNDIQVSNEDVEFKEDDKHQVYPCLTAKIIQLINFKTDRLSDSAREALSSPGACTNVQALIPDTVVEFDSSSQQLRITIPQIYVNRIAQGTVSPELWEDGIPALLFGYYLNGYDSSYSGGYSSRSVYSSFNTGLNIGAWYFRHNGSYNWQEDYGGEYQTLNTYVQRDIAPIRGRLILGEYNTTGQLFNTVSFTGAQIASDDRMLPESQRGYAPEIRGVAKTNAKVTVRQLGRIIYETTVTPGAFLINDLYPTGYGGDLDVTIQEADGSVQQYTMAYASVAQLLRPGVSQYSATAGKLRDSSLSDEPMFYELTYTRGLSNLFTGYVGTQLSENYRAYQFGLALGTSLGAISADVTQSESQLGGDAGKRSGQSYRLSYSKLINETNSNITLAAYRYSTANYLDLMSAMQTRDAIKDGLDPNSISRSKNRFTVSLNQGLPSGWGNIYVSSTIENYWQENGGYNKQYQMGYSNNLGRLSYSVNVSRSKTAYGHDQTSWYLNLSMPLDWSRDATRTSTPYLSMRYNQDTNGGKGEQAMLTGSLGENNKYSYNVTAAHDNDSGSSGSIGGTWQGRAATVNGSYSTGRDYHSTSLGMSGGMVIHSGGVTLSPYNSDTYALIEAKDAQGAKVAGYAGSQVDMFGYALYPSLVPYQMNQVSIDPEGSSMDVEFENTSQRVAPRAGAVVKVKFDTHSGTPVLITSTYQGEPLPFGAEVFDENNKYIGNVAQSGLIYARVADAKGTLKIKWGEELSARCQVSYMLMPEPAKTAAQNIPQQFNTVCTAPADINNRNNVRTLLATASN